MKDRESQRNDSTSTLTSALLNEMQGTRSNVHVIGNTNVPAAIGEKSSAFIWASFKYTQLIGFKWKVEHMQDAFEQGGLNHP